MAKAATAEPFWSSYFTSAPLAREERQRRSATVRRMAVVQAIALAVIAVIQLLATVIPELPKLPNEAWGGMGLLLLACVVAFILAGSGRPVEGAWVLVAVTWVAVTWLIYQQTSMSLVLSMSILYLWPIVAGGTVLSRTVVYGIAGLDALFFLLLSFSQTANIDNLPSRIASLLQSGIPMVVSFFLVAYIVRRSAVSLQETVGESEARAREILQTNEVLMEKSIQQVSLATQLSVSATELSATSRQQASGSAQQASAISEVTSTIEEMGYTVRQIAQSAENVAQVAEQTLEAVGRGQSAVDETVSSMEGIKGRVQELADKVLALGEHSQRIGEIMEIINNIADETHLLALNAAIESAGAGEHGRRFAVVAAEIKNLANRAMESSKEVRAIIAEIQRATNTSVMAAEDGLKETERGVSQVYQAGRAMEEIVLLAQRTSEAAQEISLATTQSRTASEQIVETMREVAEVANQTAEGSRQMADAATMLSGIAEQLQSAGRMD